MTATRSRSPTRGWTSASPPRWPWPWTRCRAADGKRSTADPEEFVLAAPARVRVRPRSTALDRDTAYRLAATEYDRFLAVLRDLDPADWNRPTDCPGWDVRAVAAHVLGTVEMASSLLEFAHQVRRARETGGGTAALGDVQVSERADLDGGGIVAGLQVTGPRALVRRRRVSRVLTPGHDGVLVADLVAEWAERHGRPYRLRLTGPAGGEWSSGTDGEELELDAVEFGRIVSGRGSGPSLLGQRVPF